MIAGSESILSDENLSDADDEFLNLSDEDDEFLRVLGSRLRTAMTRDVGTRRTFKFRGDTERHRLDTGAFVLEDGTEQLVISSRRRFRLLRRLKSWAAVRVDEPELKLSRRAAKRVSWDAARQKLVVRVVAGEDSEERIFLLEEGYIVEGPKGWRRGDEERRRPTAIWRRK